MMSYSVFYSVFYWVFYSGHRLIDAKTPRHNGTGRRLDSIQLASQYFYFEIHHSFSAHLSPTTVKFK